MSVKRQFAEPEGPASKKHRTSKSRTTETTHAQSFPTASRPVLQNQRIRFSSTSPPPEFHRSEQVDDLPTISTARPVDDEESDSAPEDVTASAAANAAKAASASLARSLEKERETKKQQRREKDSRLKAQVEDKPKKRRKRSSPPNQQRGGGAEAEENEADDVPDLLPDSLLEDESLFARPPTPEPEPKRKKDIPEKRSKVVKLDASEKRPKDVVKNGVTMSVLPKQSRVLPPKGNKQGMNIRAQWREQGRQWKEKVRLGI